MAVHLEVFQSDESKCTILHSEDMNVLETGPHSQVSSKDFYLGPNLGTSDSRISQMGSACSYGRN